MNDMQQSNKPPTHEATDVRVRPFMLILVGLFAAAAIGSVVLFSVFTWYTDRLLARQMQPAPLARITQVPPEPRLQVSPSQDWQTMLTENNQRLNSYGWVDQNAGTAHIPIERAMQLILERGLPARNPGPGLEQAPNTQRTDDAESYGGQPPVTTPEAQPGTAP